MVPQALPYFRLEKSVIVVAMISRGMREGKLVSKANEDKTMNKNFHSKLESE